MHYYQNLLLRVTLFSALAIHFAPFILAGCKSSDPPKTEDPAEVEKARQSYEDMSKREREG